MYLLHLKKIPEFTLILKQWKGLCCWLLVAGFTEYRIPNTEYLVAGCWLLVTGGTFIPPSLRVPLRRDEAIFCPYRNHASRLPLPDGFLNEVNYLLILCLSGPADREGLPESEVDMFAAVEGPQFFYDLSLSPEIRFQCNGHNIHSCFFRQFHS